MANRLTTRIYPDGLNDTFGYDPASRLLSAISSRYSNTVTRSYDNAGRLLIETLTDAIIGSASVNYGYDPAIRGGQSALCIHDY
jgi:YD repeat-containing protein